MWLTPLHLRSRKSKTRLRRSSLKQCRKLHHPLILSRNPRRKRRHQKRRSHLFRPLMWPMLPQWNLHRLRLKRPLI
ncbi:MAG: hypothetical protein ACJAXK_000513 [Yoonia sp.]|jgi:hypothetical protein